MREEFLRCFEIGIKFAVLADERGLTDSRTP